MMADAAAAGGGSSSSSSSSSSPPSAIGHIAPDDDDGGGGGGGGPASSSSPPSSAFAQVPVNALMDHNDDVLRRVCDDFTRALRAHAAEMERAGGGLYRALQAGGGGGSGNGHDNGHGHDNGPAASSSAPAPAPAPTAPPPPPPSTTGGGEAEGAEALPSIDAALLAFRGFLSSLAQAHARYAQSLTDEARRPLQALLEQQHQQHARVKGEWNRVVKNFYAQREALGQAKAAVRKAAQDREAAQAIYETAAERRSVSMAAFTADAQRARQRCEKARLQQAQAERGEREARAQLYEAVAARDDFIRTAARAYEEMERRRLQELKRAMLAAAAAEAAHCRARLRESEALERAALAVDVEGDVARMAAARRDPEATHAYARALVILDWGWKRQQVQQQQQQQQQLQLELKQQRERGRGAGPRRSLSSASAEVELASAAAAAAGGADGETAAVPGAAAAAAAADAPGEGEGDGNGGGSGGGGGGITSGIDAVLDRLLLLQPPSAASSTTPNPTSDSSSGSSNAPGRGSSPSPSPLPLPLPPFDVLIESEQGRAYFLQQLNDQRGKRLTGDVGAGYGGLGRCFQLLLDKCQASHDVRGAQQALALASTFFRESSSSSSASNENGSGGGGGGVSVGKGEREYLLPLVKAHPIWRSRRLWEDALMLGVADQLALCPQARPWEELSGEALREQVLRVHNLVFAQLASLALHMRECGLGDAEVKAFVRTMAGRTQLGWEQAAALEQQMAGWGD